MIGSRNAGKVQATNMLSAAEPQPRDRQATAKTKNPKNKKFNPLARCGGRTRNLEIKSLTLYRLS